MERTCGVGRRNQSALGVLDCFQGFALGLIGVLTPALIPKIAEQACSEAKQCLGVVYFGAFLRPGTIRTPRPLFKGMAAAINLYINFSRLQNDRLKLVPLEDSLEEWADTWVQDANLNPDTYTWLTYGPFADGAQYISWYNSHIRHDPTTILFAILLKPGTVARKSPTTGEMTTFEVANETFAGISGMVGQPEHATVDLGQMLVSNFQRTFVGTHALALLLHHCLDGIADGGLGLRRVQWQANASNTASVNAAKRLGFQLEAVIRWQQVLPVRKTGVEQTRLDRDAIPQEATDGTNLGPGRHTAMLAVCWDDWGEGVRDHVDALVRR